MLRQGVLLIALLLAPLTWAQDMSGWSDKTICRLLNSQQNNATYVQEAKSRGLACAAQAATAKQAKQQTQLIKSQGVRVYAVTLAAVDQQRLLSEPIDKTAFDFSPYEMAQLPQPLTCEFRLRRVVYEDVKEGMMEHWNMARGQLTFTANGVEVAGKWRMRGLSRDASYLKNEVNLRLTKQGDLVGKMAYFHLMVDAGEVPEKPLYIELTPHKRSQLLDLKQPKFAEFWIDVEDWAGGALRIWSCQ